MVNSQKENLFFSYVDHLTLEQYREALADLAAHSLDENPFLMPEILFPALKYLGHKDTHIGIVTNHDGTKLYALMPIKERSSRYGIMPSPCSFWHHPFSVIGTPLLHRDYAKEALFVLVQGIRQSARLGRVLYLNFIPTESKTYDLLKGECYFCHILERFQRAMLQSNLEGSAYRTKNISKRHRKNWQRARASLEKEGDVSFCCEKDSDQCMMFAEYFLKLELKSWKGRAGTALKQKGHHEAFFKKALENLSLNEKLRVFVLKFNKKAIALNITISSEKCLYLWKIAHDEAFNAFSPGVLLLDHITQDHLNFDKQQKIDGLAVPNHPVLDRLWSERREFTTMLIAPKGKRSRLILKYIIFMEALRERLKSFKKD